MWRYASMLMVCGAAISKTRPYPGFIKYQQPSLWRRLGQTRSKRDMRDNIASKIGEHSSESIRYSRNHLLELYSSMIKDERAAIEITAGLGLELEELMYISGSTKASKKLQKIYDEAQELFREGREDAEDVEFFKTPAPSGNDRQIPPGCTIKPEEKKDGGSPGKSETSNQKVPIKRKIVVEKVSELKPANLETEAEKTSKKTESKSQKSLFDF
jgi:replication factor C large subunit